MHVRPRSIFNRDGKGFEGGSIVWMGFKDESIVWMSDWSKFYKISRFYACMFELVEI